MIRMAERVNEPVLLNMACGEDSSVKRVVDDLTDITGFSGKIKWLTDRPEGQDRRMLDMSTTEKMLGFRCDTSLHDGLEKTVHWYRANRTTARNLVATQFS
jgi:GDP-L-fucose synthase